MKSNVKRTAVVSFVLLFAALLFAFAQLLYATTATAEGDGNIGRTYYKEELKNSETAQKFYGVMEEMAREGHFKDGTYEYDLVGGGILTEAEVAGYVDSANPTIPVALGAARDAFYMDHPDLFYVDVYKLYLSAGLKGGKYVAYLGTGNAENYFTDNTVSNAAEVDTAVAAYEKAVEAVAAAARAHSGETVKQIEFVNKYIVEHTEYDYGARANADKGIAYDGYVGTAYGALVNGKALCGGYSRAFKAIMDRLDIPCVLIQGSAVSGKTAVDSQTQEKLAAGAVAHMWNAVELGGLWYGVDVTWNDSGFGSEGRYLLVGDDTLSRNHFEDGVISSSGFELKYPVLRPFDYGVNEDESGFEFKDEGEVEGVEFGYSEIVMSDGESAYSLELGISYRGKNPLQLREEGKYLAARNILPDKTYGWYEPTVFYENNTSGGWLVDKYIRMSMGSYSYQLQFAIIDYPADDRVSGVYDMDKLTNAHILATSAVYTNKAYGTYHNPPYVVRRTPAYYGTIKDMRTLDVSLEYSEKLVKKDGSAITGFADLGFRVKGALHDDVEKYVVIENPQWNNETNTLSFRFTPSKQFAHNMDTYTFLLENVMGETSKKDPEPAGYYSFKMKEVVCPKVFNDGRLYMQVFGQPKFVSADDQSLNQFKDENGQPVVGNQRSQLMLVVNEPSKAENDAMKDAVLADDKLGLEEKDIKAASTYQIDLQMCGLVQKVPAGSYMRVGFGFPDGYGPDDAGVTFTVYHYKRNAQGVITEVEPVPCVVTEYGIVATVQSFSPFMICAVDSAKVQNADKGIYARVEGAGGSIDNLQVSAVKSGKSVTYTLTEESGYKVGRVLLNDADVTDQVADKKLTLSYDKLKSNNELVVSFVSERVATYREENGIQIVEPKLIVSSEHMIAAVAHEQASTPQDPPKKVNVAAIVISIVVAVVVVAAGAVLVVYFIRKNKNGGNGKKDGANKKTPTKRSDDTGKRPAQPTARPTQTAARPTQPTARPTQTAARPTQPTARPTQPTQTAARPTQTAARPAQPTARPTQTAARPVPKDKNDSKK